RVGGRVLRVSGCRSALRSHQEPHRPTHGERADQDGEQQPESADGSTGGGEEDDRESDGDDATGHGSLVHVSSLGWAGQRPVGWWEAWSMSPAWAITGNIWSCMASASAWSSGGSSSTISSCICCMTS